MILTTETPAPTTVAKPVSDLKPSEWAYDASVAHIRRWKTDFTAYHSSSNMRVLPLTNQQAFFNKCIDDDLSARVSRLVTATTPIFPAPGFVSCFDIIDEFFKECNPKTRDFKQISCEADGPPVSEHTLMSMKGRPLTLSLIHI